VPGKGFSTITVREDIAKRFDDLKRMQPNMNRQGFMSELLDFYEKYHCPECHAATVVKEKHHKC
jgi:hypothetical protein